jgi:hypothetical protein
MRKMVTSYLLILFVVTAGTVINSPIFAQTKALETIDVLVGDCICGNQMASFNAIYKGKEIEVALYYGGATKMFRGNKEIKNWHDSFCPKPGSDAGPLSGKTVTVKGKWESPDSLKANKIYYQP